MYSLGANELLKRFLFLSFLVNVRAPDGSCILTNSEDRCLRLFNLPEQIYNSEINNIPPLVSIKEENKIIFCLL